jgi:hypothetical protein
MICEFFPEKEISEKAGKSLKRAKKDFLRALKNELTIGACQGEHE